MCCMVLLVVSFFQIILGFTTGAAVHVLTAQLNKILGVALPRHTGIGKLFYVRILNLLHFTIEVFRSIMI